MNTCTIICIPELFAFISLYIYTEHRSFSPTIFNIDVQALVLLQVPHLCEDFYFIAYGSSEGQF